MGNRRKPSKDCRSRPRRFREELTSGQHPLSAFTLDIPVVGEAVVTFTKSTLRRERSAPGGWLRVAHSLDSDACPHHTGVVQSACQRTSIDALYPGNSMLEEKIMKISCERQLLTRGLSSSMTKPRTCGVSLSTSRKLVP